MPHPDGRLVEFYKAELARETAIAPHLETLLDLASDCMRVCEFGVKNGASSSALLLGTEGEVYSYDVAATPRAMELKGIAGSRWHYKIQSSLEATIPECDMLFIDSLHTFKQCSAELMRHAVFVKHRLVFHDTLTFGSVGADGESGRQSWDYATHRGQSVPYEHLGIRPAIDTLMIVDSSWAITAHYLNAHGLLVLDRR